MTDQETIERILREAKHVAVVGLTDDPTRPSHFVPAYLQNNGYHIIPINPTISGAVLGEMVYPSLAEDVYKRQALNHERTIPRNAPMPASSP